MAAIARTATYETPGRPGSPVEVKQRYGSFTGGAWLAPTTGNYRVNPSPATAEACCEIASSAPEDIEPALDAAHAARASWGRASAAGRASWRAARSASPRSSRATRSTWRR